MLWGLFMDIQRFLIENLVEIASGLGKKTGVVSSDELVGATPASFLVHAGDRYQSDEIIRESNAPINTYTTITSIVPTNFLGNLNLVIK